MTREFLIYCRRNAWLKRMGSASLRLPLFGSLLRRIAHHSLPVGERVWVRIVEGPGKDLWIKAEPYRELGYLKGDPEPGIGESIVEHLGAGDCFFDIGAHIGFYSLIAARRVGELGHVVAFEPDPDNVYLLSENASRNGFSQIGVVQAAVWNRCGKVVFQRGGSSAPHNSPRRGRVIGNSNQVEEPGVIDVDAICLDAVMHHYPSPTVIKVDVEGSETEVIRGAERVLAELRPMLICEVHHKEAKEFLASCLPRAGYRLDWLPSHPQYPFPRYVVMRPSEKEPMRLSIHKNSG